MTTTSGAAERIYQIKLVGSGCTLNELVKSALRTLRFYEEEAREADPTRGYWLAFSGGKDSVVIKRLAEMAGVRFEAHYNVTTIDPPPLVHFIREHHPDVLWERPKVPFFALMPRRGIPTRKARWCCAEYKERSGSRSVKICGIRAAESPGRAANWKVWTLHRRSLLYMLNPIFHWPDDAVWEFIRREGIPYCELYDQGWDRLGCIGCPMSRKGRIRDFARWPRFERLWRKAFGKLWDRKAGTLQRDGREWWFSARWPNPDAAFAWWLSNDSAPKGEDDSCIGLW